MWKDSRYAPNRKPKTGPNAAMLYMKPEKKDNFSLAALAASAIECLTNVHRGAFLFDVIVDISCTQREQRTSSTAKKHLREHEEQHGTERRWIALETIVFSAQKSEREG
jgi:hypothetical protein